MGDILTWKTVSTTGSSAGNLIDGGTGSLLALKSLNVNIASTVQNTAFLYEYGTGSTTILQCVTGSGQNTTTLNAGDDEIILGTGSQIYFASTGGTANANVVYKVRL